MKKVLVVFAVLILAFALVGCGSQKYEVIFDANEFVGATPEQIKSIYGEPDAEQQLSEYGLYIDYFDESCNYNGQKHDICGYGFSFAKNSSDEYVLKTAYIDFYHPSIGGAFLEVPSDTPLLQLVGITTTVQPSKSELVLEDYTCDFLEWENVTENIVGVDCGWIDLDARTKGVYAIMVSYVVE